MIGRLLVGVDVYRVLYIYDISMIYHIYYLWYIYGISMWRTVTQNVFCEESVFILAGERFKVLHLEREMIQHLERKFNT